MGLQAENKLQRPDNQNLVREIKKMTWAGSAQFVPADRCVPSLGGEYAAGHDLETGKAIYRNVLGQTQKEGEEKRKAAEIMGFQRLASLREKDSNL